jgi:branched-chain amino acid transport system permease protein
MSIFLQNMVQLTQGARVKPIPPMLEAASTLTGRDGLHGARRLFADPDHRRHGDR